VLLKFEHFVIFSLTLLIIVSILCQSASAQEQKTYTIYVEPNSVYQKYIYNVMEDATTAWHTANPNINFVLTDSPTQPYDFEVQWIKDNTGDPWAGEALIQNHIMQVTFGDSFCGGTWQPYSHATIVSLATHELGHLLGMGHSTDLNNVMSPNRNDFEYAQREIEANLAPIGYEVIPLCNKWDDSSYNYIITNDDPAGLNYYFVPSTEVPEIYSNGAHSNFQPYTAQGCYGHVPNGQIQGSCSGIPPHVYLIIVPPPPPAQVIGSTYARVMLTDTTPQPQYYVPTIPVCQSGQQLVMDAYGQQCVGTITTPLQAQTQTTPQKTSNQIRADGTDYLLDYSITNGKVLGIKAYIQSKSLIVSIQTTGDGQLTIDLPRALIDAKKTDQTDDQFFVLTDGKEAQFTETPTTTDRTLIIPFTDGTGQIEIIGTQIVPEFGSLAGMVIAISIIGVVLISRKLRFHPLPHYT